jgi:hypothetical protein
VPDFVGLGDAAGHAVAKKGRHGQVPAGPTNAKWAAQHAQASCLCPGGCSQQSTSTAGSAQAPSRA